MFNVLLTYFILGQRTSLAAIVCCGTIVAGFYLGVDQVRDISDDKMIIDVFESVLRKIRRVVSPCQAQFTESSPLSSYPCSPFSQRR